MEKLTSPDDNVDYRSIFDASPDAVFILDPAGQILNANLTAIKRYGYSLDELKRMNAAGMAAPHLREKAALHIRQSLQPGVQFECVHRCKDGRELSVEIFSTPIRYRGEPVILSNVRDMADRQPVGVSMRDSERRLARVIDGSDQGFWDWNLQINAFTVSDRFKTMLGYAPEEMDISPAHWVDYVYPDDLVKALTSIKRHIGGESPLHEVELRIRAKSGEWRWVLTRGRVVEWTGDGRPLMMSGTHTDITERKQTEEKLRLVASVFSHAREGITITTVDGTIIDVNDAFTRITGYTRDEVLGRNPRILSSGRQSKAFYVAMWRDLIDKGHWSGEIWNRRKDGEVYVGIQTISAVSDAQGKTQHYVALFADITPIKEHERQLEQIAHYDVLTTLPNRVLLADRLRQAMAQSLRRDQRLAVAYLDLDGFKAVNDRFGHDTGDKLLITLATRMAQVLREGDTLGRLGGDEFIAILIDLPEVAASLPLLGRLLAAAAQPVKIGDFTLQVSASIGVTFYPQPEDVDADQLLRQADQAMYQAKLAGKNRFHLFDADQDRSVRGRHASLGRIRHALAAREFVLHYQPKVNMRTGRVVGAEALIRWQHPEQGLLLPGVFLSVIEDHPLAVEIGEWVIESALIQLERWQAAGLNLTISVNVGASQLQQANFVERLRQILAAHPRIRPSDLVLEVLETSALEDLVKASQVIEACHDIGVNFALDDFGTGYSSLTYLKRLAVAQLKIDQSFVHDMLDDPDDLAILEGVLGLATAFRRQVVAEGVETAEHGELLLQLGCELAQGNGIAPPMPADEIPAWASGWQPDPRWRDRQPVSRDDLPLLFATTEHRAWVGLVANYLQGERTTPPQLCHQQCHFGQWLAGTGRVRHGTSPVFRRIERLHREMHGLATTLCTSHVQSGDTAPPAGLERLLVLRDSLLEQLKVLLGDSRQ